MIRYVFLCTYRLQVVWKENKKRSNARENKISELEVCSMVVNICVKHNFITLQVVYKYNDD